MIKRDQFDKVTSGGGGGGTATATNQQTQITEAQTSNTKLTSIDTKVSTAAKQDTGNSSLSSIDTKLSTENTNSTNTATYLSSIRTPNIISSSTTGTIAPQVHRISFANIGNAVATITVNGNTVNLPVGVTINYNAGGNNNRFPINIFSYNGTGTTLLITYVQ